MLMITLGGLLSLAGSSACAQTLTIDGEEITLSIDSDEGSALMGIDVLEMYGYTGEDTILVSYDIQREEGETDTYYGTISAGDLTEQLPLIDLSQIPQYGSISAVPTGSSGDEAKALQENLISLKYLSGEADGMYGSGTAAAVSAFQTEYGLPASGSADLNTMLVLESVLNPLPDQQQTYPTVLTAEQKFASILDLTDDDLEPYVESEWRFSYDKFTQTGSIDPSLNLGYITIAEPASEEMYINVSYKIIIRMDEESGRLQLIPALATDSYGAYRPYIQSVILASDTQSVTCEGAVSEGELYGAYVDEQAYVPLTDEAIELLKSGEKVSLRLVGMNQTYDLDEVASTERFALLVE